VRADAGAISDRGHDRARLCEAIRGGGVFGTSHCVQLAIVTRELIMAIEEDLGAAFILPDELASRTDTATFRELVQHVAAKQRAV